MWVCFAFLMGLKHVNATPSSRKTPLRGHKSPICEECRKANFLLKKLTWGNAGRSASERFPSDPRTHISPIIVHRALLFEKKGGGKSVGKGRVGGWRFLYTGYCAR